jgi:hypothetical protein
VLAQRRLELRSPRGREQEAVPTYPVQGVIHSPSIPKAIELDGVVVLPLGTQVSLAEVNHVLPTRAVLT